MTIMERIEQENFRKGIVQGIEKGREEGIEKGREEGIEKGREEGIEKAKIETAMKMLKIGLDLRSIEDVTGISMQEILKIKANM